MKSQLLAGCAAAALTATPVLAQAPSPMFNWSGFYAGLNAGYSWGSGAVNYNEPVLGSFGLPTTFMGSSRLNGPIGGAQIGYNWQAGNFVTGMEADLQASSESASRSSSFPFDCEGICTLSGILSSQIEWFGTVRGRIGWLPTPTLLVYATGGLAYGGVKVSGNFADTSCTPVCTWGFDKSAVNFGYTVGGGIEGAWPQIADWNVKNWTWKIEYLYINLGSVSGTGFETDFHGPYTYSATFTDNILRFGVNYNFH